MNIKLDVKVGQYRDFTSSELNTLNQLLPTLLKLLIRIYNFSKTISHNFLRAIKELIAVSSTSFHFFSSSPHKSEISCKASGPCSPPSNSICLSR